MKEKKSTPDSRRACFDKNDCLRASHRSAETPANCNCALLKFLLILRQPVMETKLLSPHFILASLLHTHTRLHAYSMQPGCRPGGAAAAACGCRCFVLKL